MKSIFLGTALLACTSMAATAADISFKERFARFVNEKQIVVQAAPTDTLVIEPGTYYLDGRSLIVAAEKVRLAGDVSIISFTSDSAPPMVGGVAATGASGAKGADASCGGNGCDGAVGAKGETGQTGTKGRKPGRIELDVGELTGEGLLLVKAIGQKGGKGQQGGKGGTGGQAGRGADRKCNFGLNTESGPGNAGLAGRGGDKGQGGQGGTGGDGGEVVVRITLLSVAHEGKLLRVTAPGGSGGEGGDAGEPGEGGLGNDGGSGGSCGGGGTGSGKNTEAPGGTVSLQGERGDKGQIIFVDAANPTDPVVWQEKVEFKAYVIHAWPEFGCGGGIVRSDDYCAPQGYKIVDYETAKSRSSYGFNETEFKVTPRDKNCLHVEHRVKRKIDTVAGLVKVCSPGSSEFGLVVTSVSEEK